MSDSPETVVRDFCAAWRDLDVDRIASYFADDAVYHNIPIDPVTGRDAIRDFIAGFLTGVEALDFRIDHLAVSGDAVLTERVDTFRYPDRTIALPVMGTFEVHDGRITAWRDYFDLNQFMAQNTPAG